MSIPGTPPPDTTTPPQTGVPPVFLTPAFSEILPIGWLFFWRSQIILIFALIPVAIIAGIVLTLAGAYEDDGLLGLTIFLLALPLSFLVCIQVAGMAHRKHYKHFRLHHLDAKSPGEGQIVAPQPGDFMCVAWLILWRFSAMMLVFLLLADFVFPLSSESGFFRVLEAIVYIGFFFWVIYMALKKKYERFRLVLVRNSADTLLARPS